MKIRISILILLQLSRKPIIAILLLKFRRHVHNGTNEMKKIDKLINQIKLYQLNDKAESYSDLELELFCNCTKFVKNTVIPGRNLLIE